ncbi:hypothetical protein JXD20_03080 [Candidatus Peregrinibacteria bacterium]|nr:hypothetical protein [Candidatus Peregrinibacteria bacterium]
MFKKLFYRLTGRTEIPSDVRNKNLLYVQLHHQNVDECRRALIGLAYSCPHNDDRTCKNQILRTLRTVPKDQLLEAVQILTSEEVLDAYREHIVCSWKREVGHK